MFFLKGSGQHPADYEYHAYITQEQLNGPEGIIQCHVNGGYGRSISAHGIDGYISCLEERQKRELEYLERSDVNSIIIENAHRDWKQAYEKIADSLV